MEYKMIKTKRLNIVPLLYGELQEYVTTRSGSVTTDKDALWVIENHLFKMDGTNDLFFTFWLAIDTDKDIIAEGAFKGVPNEFGEIEIGCYVSEECRGKGYGTELIGAMVDWAKEQTHVEFVVAQVSPENNSSQKMLKNNNFTYWGDKGGMKIFYKKSKN